MKSRQIIVLLIFLALIDNFIALAFPVNFQFYGYSFVPHLAFSALMLIVYDKQIFDRVLICGLCGIICAMFFTGSIFSNFVLYSLLGALVGLLGSYMENDVRVRFFIVLGIVFFIDLIPFCTSSWSGTLSVSLGTWFLHHELLTIALHIIIILILMYSLDVYRRYNVIRSHRKKIQERKHYLKFRASH